MRDKKKDVAITLFLLITVIVFGQQKIKHQADAKFLQDKAPIESMTGCYKVSFDFAETFSSDITYKYHDRYHSWGIEYVFILEETDKKVSLQHLLIVDDTTIVKHWREDWIYENTELLFSYKDKVWNKVTIIPEKAKGTWTQKVCQVDDGPNYESYGTWVHFDGRNFWESTCDAPLPRRDFTKRSDYNVLRRHNHIELTNDGWTFNQDNEKILRDNGIDKTLCWEKGVEKFAKGNYNCQIAIDWWDKNKQYWADVRRVWKEEYPANSSIKIRKKIDNTILFEQLFKIGDDYSKVYNSDEALATIKKTIEMYLITN